MKKLLFTIVIAMIPFFAAAAEKSSTKKGVCLGGQSGEVIEKQLESLNISWHYNWTPTWQGKKINNAEYVPMFWGDRPWCHSGYPGLKVDHSKMQTSPLLTFNEPDRANQSNMTVAKALEMWPMMEKTNRRLGSPVTVHADNAWMKEFMKEAEKKNYRIDFICVHWYGVNDADNFINHIESIYKLYKKPIWITEFAIADWKAKDIKDNKEKPADVIRFMRKALPKLEKLKYVERYAWFTCSTKSATLGNSGLFKDDGSLTEVGEFYSKFAK